MASQGPNSPGTLADDSAVGTVTWSNPSNASSSNDVWATAQTNFSPKTTHYLKCTNFGFSITSGATIDGVVVEIERKASANSASFNVVDSVVKLVKGGSIVGNNKADTTTKYPVSPETIASYGSSSDLWGTTLSDTDVNASNFGVVLSSTITTTGKTNVVARVDHIKITVYYTTGGGGGSSTNALLYIGD